MTPKPMPPKPQEFSMVCGWRASQNCMNQLWWTPTSSVMIASSGNTRRTAPTTDSGRSGEVSSAKFGPREVLATPAASPRSAPCHARPLRHLQRRARRSSASIWRRNTARVRNDAEIDRIVAADLGHVDIHLDQLRGGKVPGIALDPGRGGAIVEARADHQHKVGVAAGLVGRIGAVAADEAERKSVRHRQAAHAVGRGDHRDAQTLGERGQFLGRLRQRHAVADEQRRALGRRQHVERLGDVLGRGAASGGRCGCACWLRPRARPPPGTG